MDDVTKAAQTIAEFLQVFTLNSGLRLRYRVKLRGAAAAGDAPATDADAGPAADAESPRKLYVEFSGPDSAALTARNGELLNSLEHLASKILRLEPEQHDMLTFDADHFKADRDRQMRESAAAAIEKVRTSGTPHAFPAMSSRERRTLHMLLSESGLPTASSGEGPQRFVVLYPAGADTSVPFESEAPRRRPDPRRMRDNFRHR